ncbi:ATP-binding cassette domain-containing protein [Herbivorax sp. ANBcel31]|uniref:ABC transporter ATP-binding protein n=1 Tax=Herbivorax sp. ANBcel31 TaxID=3069754 RepID=UPI0027AEAF3D|nr:ATP-binding cassette domain-containing protein [Herbivorax sp. ANBcel31]MDQ2086703.1 ATP-binding cassette domain-containing protein [Herbivorax sp. ANBcel31]
MIEIQNLTKHYGSIKAVKNLNFTVEKGEILGFLGPNGAGKTTTMNMITGYLPSTEGTVKVCGYDIGEKPAEVKKHIGYLPEIPPVYTDLTVKEYLNFVSDLKKVSKSKRSSQMSDIMETVKITDVQNRLVGNLSKGYRQRVGLAQALVGNPEVLILDEPTVGLDPNQIIEIRKLIKNLGKEHTIIFSSHILQEVSAVCERVVIINKGEIAAIDTPDKLSENLDNVTRFLIKIEGAQKSVKEALSKIKGILSVESDSKSKENVFKYMIDSEKDVDVRRPIFFKMAELGFPILELQSIGMNLEDIFRKITAEEKQTQEKQEVK